MKLNLRIAAGLLLLIQTFHTASLQNSTDSPGRTILREWLRDLPKNKAESHDTAVPGVDTEYDQGADVTAAEAGNDYSSGIASGSMAEFKEEGDSVPSQDDDANDGADDLTAVNTTVPPTNPNVTTQDPELPDTTVSPSNATTDLTNSSSINATEAEEEFNTTTIATTTTKTLRHSTGSPHHSHHTHIRKTTSAPGGNATRGSTTRDEETWTANATDSTNTTAVTTTAAPEMNGTSASSSTTTALSSSTSATPEMHGTSTASSPTTVFSSETTETSTTTQTVAERANRTDDGSASGGNPERGLESDPHRSKRNGAWGAVLGTAVAVAFVGLVAYVILKRKHQKGFTHRKLVEEYPSDPVLRLDNGEPLDLNLGGSAYYNPTLQGDSIQMSNLPGRR
ncbi:uncharacterized protein AB9X84_006800 [Acanthopagrus schlegelii]